MPTQDLYEKLAARFGPEFAEKFLRKIQEKRRLPPEMLEKITKWALEEVKIHELDNCWAKYENYDVFLATSPSNVTVKNTGAGNWKVGLLNPASEDGWISCFFSDRETAYSIEPDSIYLVIGKAREREYLGVRRISVNVLGIVKIDGERMVPVSPESAEQEQEQQEPSEQAQPAEVTYSASPMEMIKESAEEQKPEEKEEVPEIPAPTFSEEEMKILGYLHKRGSKGAKVETIAKNVGLSEKDVRKLLISLASDGYVWMPSSGQYAITEKGRKAMESAGE